jgi:hypothetical protein
MKTSIKTLRLKNKELSTSVHRETWARGPWESYKNDLVALSVCRAQDWQDQSASH